MQKLKKEKLLLYIYNNKILLSLFLLIEYTLMSQCHKVTKSQSHKNQICDNKTIRQ